MHGWRQTLGAKRLLNTIDEQYFAPPLKSHRLHSRLKFVDVLAKLNEINRVARIHTGLLLYERGARESHTKELFTKKNYCHKKEVFGRQS